MTSFSDRTFGVELEMTSSTTDGSYLNGDRIFAAVQAAVHAVNPTRNVRNCGYTHSNGTSWDVKTDSSCGWEVATPALTFDADGNCSELAAGVAALQQLRPVVNSTCGLHVHVATPGWSWQDLQRLVRAWAEIEPYFYDLCPASRRTNHYSHEVARSAWNSAINASRGVASMLAARTPSGFTRAAGRAGRGSLNLNHFWRSGRVEFRLQGGTVNPVKVAQWARLCVALVSAVGDTRTPIANLPLRAPVTRTPLTTRAVFTMLGLAATILTTVPIGAHSLEQWAERRRARLYPATVAAAQAAPQAAPAAPLAVWANAAARSAMERTVQATTNPRRRNETFAPMNVDRARRVRNLRTSGHSFAEIAAIIGVGVPRARQIFGQSTRMGV